MEFRWNDWNLEHATQHGIGIDEIECLIERAIAPFPEYRGDDKWIVQGQGIAGRFIQAIYIIDDDGSFYVIHARPLNELEKRRYRKRMR